MKHGEEGQHDHKAGYSEQHPADLNDHTANSSLKEAEQELNDELDEENDDEEVEATLTMKKTASGITFQAEGFSEFELLGLLEFHSNRIKSEMLEQQKRRDPLGMLEMLLGAKSRRVSLKEALEGQEQE